MATEDNVIDLGNLFDFSAVLANLLAADPYTLLITIGCVAVSAALYRVLFAPAYIYKPLTNVGATSRRPGNTPPPYPTGWFGILHSSDVKRGQVREVQFMGQTLAVYRGRDSGKVAILDAFCPHLGANLASHGGLVHGDNIVCPFHGWEFNIDGKCTHIPYDPDRRIPDSTRCVTWRFQEYNDHIWIWHNAEDMTAEPSWQVPYIEEINNGSFRQHGRSIHEIAVHIQEIAENGADVGHLGYLHKPFFFSWIPWLSHIWTVTWNPSTANPHMTDMQLTESLALNGKKMNWTQVDVAINQIGPGIVVLKLVIPVLGRAHVVQTVTPKGPLLQRVTHTIFTERRIPRFIAKILLHFFVMQFERDIDIWNRKIYRDKPTLVAKDDRLIVEFRRWFSRFYPKKQQQQENQQQSKTVDENGIARISGGGATRDNNPTNSLAW
eukprot:GEZU01033025.1.p1 GENE.GEZU01033025.1~~GEZU01033025.1.p1  ORF type:complete len:456 (+),score=93.61 GEZU01033025.1:59-1369(+)